MRLQQNIEYRNRRGTDYVIINRFDRPPNETEKSIHQYFEKNVVQKCFQHVEGVSSKYPKISRKNLAKEYLVLRRAKDKISGLLWKRKDFLSSFAIMSFCHVQVEEIPWTDVDEGHEIATEY